MGFDFSLHKSEINKYFPFFFIVDENLKIVGAGNSFKKIFPNWNVYLNDIFKLKRPTKVINSIQDLNEITNTLVFLDSHLPNKLMFRGNFDRLEFDNSKIIFMGSPWFDSVEGIKQNNLTIKDFALHDSIIEFMHIIKNQELVYQDIQLLLKQVNNQKKELTKSTTRLESLLKNLNKGILLEDENRKIIIVNEIFCDLFSIPVLPEKLIGLDCSESAEQSKNLFFNPEKFVSRINEIVKNKELVLNEELIMVDGKYLIRDFIPLWIQNEYQGHLWVYTNVTESKINEIKLKASEQRYKDLINKSKTLILVHDLNGKITSANPIVSDILGLNHEKIIGQSISLFFNNKRKKYFKEYLNILRENRKFDGDYKVVDSVGKEFYFLFKNYVHINSNEEEEVVCFAQDITTRKSAEKELIKAKKLTEENALIKQKFISNMSHEIRTPLNGLIGLISLLEKTNLDNQQKEMVSMLKDASESLLFISNQVLDIQKINSGKYKLEISQFNLNDRIIKTFTSFKVLAIQKKLDYKIFIKENEEIYVESDPLRFNQIISNLLNNAIKFTDDGKVELNVKYEKIDENNINCIIEVSDTGIGISEKNIEHIFEPFIQDENILKNNLGTGLGLSIVKELLHLFNGKILVNSVLGKGSNFKVLIPFKTIEQQNKINNSMIDYRKDFSGFKILVAEDVYINQFLVAKILKNLKIDYKIVNNGLEVLKELEKENYDAILMDIQMPEMSGIEATIQLRNKNINTPIVGLSAHVLQEDVNEYISKGMNYFLTKPFKMEELCILLEKLLDDGKKEKLYDLSYLKEISNGDDDFYNSMIKIFVDSVPLTIADLKASAKKSDLDSARKIVHKIKPSLEALGMTEAKEIVLEIMNNKALDNHNLNSLILRLLHILESVSADINKQ